MTIYLVQNAAGKVYGVFSKKLAAEHFAIRVNGVLGRTIAVVNQRILHDEVPHQPGYSV